MSFIDDIKQSYRSGDALAKLIYVNLFVFVGLHLFRLILFLFRVSTTDGIILDWLAIPSNLTSLLFKPWTILTYMFLHEGFFHIISNIIILYFTGRIFLQYLGDKKLIATYVMGGLWGGLLYILAYNIFPAYSESVGYSRALGASGSVMAVLVAIATHIPNLSVSLFRIIDLKLKYIALFLILLDILSVPGMNSGGHVIHLGGAAFGYFFIRQFHKGKDWSATFYGIIYAVGSLFKSSGKSKIKVAYRNEGKKAKKARVDQDKIDIILDKISKSGYDSLSKEEKDTLFKASNN